MCDEIVMPDGAVVETIPPNDYCLCRRTQKSILIWIVSHIPDLEIDQTLEILHNPFGYVVHVKNKENGEVTGDV